MSQTPHYAFRGRDPASAPGVPPFKSKDSVLNRPDGDPARAGTVAPGTFTFAAATSGDKVPQPAASSRYAVTWWDPRALHLGAAAPFGLRRDDLIVR